VLLKLLSSWHTFSSWVWVHIVCDYWVKGSVARAIVCSWQASRVATHTANVIDLARWKQESRAIAKMTARCRDISAFVRQCAFFLTPPLVSPKFPRSLGVGGWRLGYEERKCWTNCGAVSFQLSNLCGHSPPTLQTDRQMDVMRSQYRALHWSASCSKILLIGKSLRYVVAVCSWHHCRSKLGQFWTLTNTQLL